MSRSILLPVFLFFLFACQSPEATLVDIPEPDAFAKIIYPPDNPTTEEGLALGRALFFDPLLSADSTISCSTCHLPELAFTDGQAISTGIDGRLGRRNAPGLTNVGYLHETLFWDGRADDLETQALHPVADPNEMGGSWQMIISKLRQHPDYWPQFQRAFGLETIGTLNPDHVGKALAQYQRSLISADAKYDKVERGETEFTEEEALGQAIFFDVADDPAPGKYAGIPTGECSHCHIPPHFTNQLFFNNGLDEVLSLDDFKDPGRGPIAGSVYENGKFRVPSLRNVALTGPYMHDGRFNSLEEVVDHYDSGGQYAENRNPNIFPLGLSPDQHRALVAFLRTLTDTSFVNRTVKESGSDGAR